MRGGVTVSRIASDRSVSSASKSVLVAVFLVSSISVFFVAPTSALYVGEDIGWAGYNTQPTGINDLDQVAGFRHWNDWNATPIYNSDAIVYNPETGAWTVLQDFGAGGGIAQDISEDGEVIGNCRSPTGEQKGAYWPAGYGTVVLLNGLYSNTSTTGAVGMNDIHEAVGYCVVNTTVTTAVLWDLDPNATAITPLDLGAVEGAYSTCAVDINNNHEVVGYFVKESDNVTRHEAFYCAGYGSPLQELLPLSEEYWARHTIPYSISDSGMIVGTSSDSTGQQFAVAWLPPYDALPVDLGAIVGGSSIAHDVSTDEIITGVGPLGAFVLDYSSGTCEYLDPPSGIVGGCIGLAINDLGHVAGMGSVENGESHTILWTPDAPPVAAFTATVSGFNVTVNASASYDAEGQIANYSWDFGDGTFGSAMVVTHTYADVGPYNITLTVTDGIGQSDSMSQVVGFDETPESEIVELVGLIEQTSFEQTIKDLLTAKALKALDLIEVRKKGGDDGPANILLSLDNLVSNYVLVGKIADEYEAWDVIAQTNFAISLLAEDHIVGGVPVYTWYHGCGPTAAGMLLGYWDATGFGELVKGPQGNEMFQSDEVNAMIASQSHIEDYAYPYDGWVVVNGETVWVPLTPDKSESGDATDDDCIADFMHTSRSAEGLVWGQSYVDMLDDALVDYTHWASAGRYKATVTSLQMGAMTWEILQSEVTDACPMVFVIDWNGDGETDHLVTVIGYCEVGKAQLYAFYSTWDNYVYWALFDAMHEGNFYGVSSGITLSISQAS